jgi:hypothetical protein
MKFILSLLARLKFRHPHNDNLRTFDDDSAIKGYAVILKAH